MTLPLSIYIHIPFCTVKCGYCDFNAYAGMDGLKFAYTAAVIDEIRRLPRSLFARPIATVAFGGGTPGEMTPDQIGSILAAIQSRFRIVRGAEISLEANPGTVDGEALNSIRRAGVTRLSLGAQSFDPAELAFLDRIHSPEATVASVGLARAARFDSVGLDLIYGLPSQTTGSWEQNLHRAIALGVDHVSTYGLTVELGTPLAARVAAGQVVLPDDDCLADMYEHGSDVLLAAGFTQYELSNWARPGHESRHNQVYWRDGHYLGIGAGAHGYLDGERYENIAHPRSYVVALESAETDAEWPARCNAYFSPTSVAMADFVTLRLRLLEGLRLNDFVAKFGRPLGEVFGPVMNRCTDAGVLEFADGSVRLTPRGRLLHGEVAVQLLDHAQGAT